MVILERDGEVIFLYKIEFGFVDKFYGIYVVKIVGLLIDLLDRVIDILL